MFPECSYWNTPAFLTVPNGTTPVVQYIVLCYGAVAKLQLRIYDLIQNKHHIVTEFILGIRERGNNCSTVSEPTTTPSAGTGKTIYL